MGIKYCFEICIPEGFLGLLLYTKNILIPLFDQ